MKAILPKLAALACVFVIAQTVIAQTVPPAGGYVITGYFFHNGNPRQLALSKNLVYQGIDPSTKLPQYLAAVGDIAVDGYYFTFEVNAANQLVNWAGSGNTPQPPSSGFMANDSDAAAPYPGATTGYVSKTYNNTYNPATHTFYMHYGFNLDAGSGQNTFDRDVYEEWSFAGVSISSFSPVNVTQGSTLTIKGIGFTRASLVYFGNDSIMPTSYTVVSDSVITAVVGKGASGTVNVVAPKGNASLAGLVYTAPAITDPHWGYAGNNGFSAAGVRSVNIAAGPNNVPYVAFVDSSNHDKVVVMKLGSNNTWVGVGGTVSDGAAIRVAIVVDKLGNPYVAYGDSLQGNNLTVKKYNGSAWVTLGTAGFAPITTYANSSSIALDSLNNLYVLSMGYIDSTGLYPVYVYKFNGSAWATVGGQVLQSVSGDASLAVDKLSNTPYVVSDDNATYQGIVKKYTNSTWQMVGTGDITSSANGVYYPTIAINTSGNPVVAFQNDNGGEQASAYQFANGQWNQLGAPYFSPGHVYFVSLSVNHNSQPYVSFIDQTNYQQGTVMQYANGAWSALGTPGFVTANVFTKNALLSTGNDSVYIAFADKNNSNKATVVEYFTGNAPAITSFTPTSVTQGTSLTIKGTGFTGATSVFFGSDSIKPTSFTVVSDSVITAVVGKGATGTVNVVTPRGAVSLAGLVYTAPAITNAQWSYTGSKGFSAAGAAAVSIAAGPNNLPYVVYVDLGNKNKATVMKLGTNNTWAAVGSAVSDSASSRPGIVVDKLGNPYAVYVDSANGGNLTVKKYNGSAWSVVGTAGFAPMKGYANSTSIAIDSANNLYVLSLAPYSGSGFPVNVYTFNGSAWAALGGQVLASGSGDATVAVDKLTNTPYVVSDDYNNGQGLVKKYSAGAWQTVGGGDITSSLNGTYYPGIAVTAGVPTVAFQNDNGGEQTSAYQLANSKWGSLGSPYFSPGHAYYVSLSVNHNSTPFVSFIDATNYMQGTVMTYANGAWSPLGALGFVTTASFTKTALLSTGNDSVYIAFADKNNGNKATVMQFVAANTPVITSFSPAGGTTDSTVTIKGKYFTGATKVSFGNAAALSFKVVSDSVLTAVIGQGASGSVAVTTPVGTATKSGFTFCYAGPPVVTIADSVANTAAGTAICAGVKVKFTATVKNGGAAPVYQWLKNNAKVGTNSATYTDSLLKTNDSVTVTVTDSAACSVQKSTTAKAIKFTVSAVAAAPTVTVADSVGTSANVTTVCAGTKVKFKATAVNGGTTPAYQWEKNGLKVGTNSATYTDSLLKNGDSVQVVVTSNTACAMPDSAKSKAIKFVVNTLVAPSVTIVDSVGTTANVTTICTGTKVKFRAVPVNGGTTPAYQWKKNGVKVGTNSATYTDSLLKNGDSVQVVVTSNAACAAPDSVKSKAIKFVVNAPVAPSATIIDSVGTTANVTTICSGTKVKFRATAVNGGTTPAYQWKKNGAKVGTNSATYTDSLLKNGDSVQVVVTSNAACAVPDSVKSKAIKFVVNATVAPSVTIVDSVGTSANVTTICTATKVKFKATAVNGGTTPAYQWKKNGVKVGTNSATYTDSTLKNGDSVQVVVTSNATCALPDSVKSASLKFTVQTGVPAEPSAISGPASVKVGETGIVFKVTNVAGIKYLWTVPALDTITNTTGLDSIVVKWHSAAGTVSVKASDACGTSAAVTKAIAVTSSIDLPVEDKFAPVTATLYPNPAASQSTLLISGFDGSASVIITDLSGKTVWRQDKQPNGTYTLPLDKLANGMYLVVIRDQKNIKTLKLVKAQ